MRQEQVYLVVAHGVSVLWVRPCFPVGPRHASVLVQARLTYWFLVEDRRTGLVEARRTGLVEARRTDLVEGLVEIRRTGHVEARRTGHAFLVQRHAYPVCTRSVPGPCLGHSYRSRPLSRTCSGRAYSGSRAWLRLGVPRGRLMACLEGVRTRTCTHERTLRARVPRGGLSAAISFDSCALDRRKGPLLLRLSAGFTFTPLNPEP